MEWQKRELGELADISRGSSPRPIADTRYFDGGTVPWVKIERTLKISGTGRNWNSVTKMLAIAEEMEKPK